MLCNLRVHRVQLGRCQVFDHIRGQNQVESAAVERGVGNAAAVQVHTGAQLRFAGEAGFRQRDGGGRIIDTDHGVTRCGEVAQHFPAPAAQVQYSPGRWPTHHLRQSGHDFQAQVKDLAAGLAVGFVAAAVFQKICLGIGVAQRQRARFRHGSTPPSPASPPAWCAGGSLAVRLPPLWQAGAAAWGLHPGLGSPARVRTGD